MYYELYKDFSNSCLSVRARIQFTENKLEISYFTKGSCLNLIDDEKITVNHDCIVCNPFDKSVKLLAENYHEHHTVCFYLPYEKSLENREGFSRLPYLTNAYNKGKKALKLIDEIIKQSALNPNRKLTLAGLFFSLIDEVNALNSPCVNDQRPSDLAYVENAKKYIYNNLNKQISQRDVASSLNVTSEYLCSVFKKIEGVPFIRFVNQTKLKK